MKNQITWVERTIRYTQWAIAFYPPTSGGRLKNNKIPREISSFNFRIS